MGRFGRRVINGVINELLISGFMNEFFCEWNVCRRIFFMNGGVGKWDVNEFINGFISDSCVH